jgi:beta-glucanase (GH16 family)
MKRAVIVVSMLAFGALAAYAKVPAGYGLAWSDEFNGTSLDTLNAWSYDTGANQPNAEQEYYTRGCVTVENGNCVIWSKYNPSGVNNATSPSRAKYTSGRINSGDKKIFKYGYFEVRLTTPVGQVSGPGLWSAVWLLGNSINHGVAWPTCGEMELYEQRPSNAVVAANAPQPVPAIVGDNEFIGTCHYGVNGGASYHSCQKNYARCLCDGFHTYGVLWDSTHVEYYFDDTLYWAATPLYPSAQFVTPNINLPENKLAFHSPFFWIMNVAVGGAYQGQNINNAIFPTKMLIDYVRVYQNGVITAVDKDVREQALHSFALVNPATAMLKVYDLSGKLVADYSSKVRQMKTGDHVMKMLPSTLSNGAYVVRLTDNGLSTTSRLVTAR